MNFQHGNNHHYVTNIHNNNTMSDIGVFLARGQSSLIVTIKEKKKKKYNLKRARIWCLFVHQFLTFENKQLWYFSCSSESGYFVQIKINGLFVLRKSFSHLWWNGILINQTRSTICRNISSLWIGHKKNISLEIGFFFLPEWWVFFISILNHFNVFWLAFLF